VRTVSSSLLIIIITNNSFKTDSLQRNSLIMDHCSHNNQIAQRKRNMKYLTVILLLMLGASPTKAFQIKPLSSTRMPTLGAKPSIHYPSLSPLISSKRISSLRYQDKDDVMDDIAHRGFPADINGALRTPAILAATASLQSQLLQKIGEFKALRERDQSSTNSSRASKTNGPPQTIDFYSISEEVGDKVQEIVQLCNEIARYNPTPEPTKFLGDRNNGDSSPLNGSWRSLFTTASDANFPKRKGQLRAPNVQNIVNAQKGTITNVVDFPPKLDGSDPTFKQLKVVIDAKPVSKNRVELQFKYAKALLTKLLWFKLQWTLFIPVPPPFVVRCLVAISRFVKGLGKKNRTTGLPPRGYFDVLYLDENLRVHKTGEENYFVQARENWEPAQALWAS
jgi:hypothetical protein